MKKKIGAVFIGILAIGAIIYTGFLSFTDENGYLTILYGIVTAVLAPVAISLIQWAFTKTDKTLEELKKVPAIQQLLDEVRRYETEVKKLKDERHQLLEIVQEESKLFMLQERKASLEMSAKNINEEISEINALIKEEPNANYKYLPEIVARIEKDSPKSITDIEKNLFTLLDGGLFSMGWIFSIFVWLFNIVRRKIIKWKDKKTDFKQS